MILQQVTTGELLAQLVAGLTALMLGCTLIGLAVKFVLLPWLQLHLLGPMREVTHQVTVNGHVSDVPTLLDRVDAAAGLAAELRTQVDQLVELSDDQLHGQLALGRMLDGHLDRSGTEWGRMWDAIRELRALIGAPNEGNEDG